MSNYKVNKPIIEAYQKSMFKERLFKEGINFKYMAKHISSKLRGIGRIFGLIDPKDKLLKKYQELENLYIEFLFGADPQDVEFRMKVFLKDNPTVLDEIVTKVKKNIYDLSPKYIEAALYVISQVEGDDEEVRSQTEEIWKNYNETRDIKILRVRLEQLIDDEIDKVRNELENETPHPRYDGPAIDEG